MGKEDCMRPVCAVGCKDIDYWSTISRR